MIIINNLTSNSQQAFSLEASKRIGEKINGKIIYSKYEALYLAEAKKAKLIKKIKLNEKEKINYLVFRDLTKKGYIVKTAKKFGSEFRVYKKKNAHALYLVYSFSSSKLDINELIAKNRVAHSAGKTLLLAVIDSENDITYFEIKWLKP